VRLVTGAFLAFRLIISRDLLPLQLLPPLGLAEYELLAKDFGVPGAAGVEIDLFESVDVWFIRTVWIMWSFLCLDGPLGPFMGPPGVSGLE
jgi:hypothetical protein